MTHFIREISIVLACGLLAAVPTTTASAQALVASPATYSVVLRNIDWHPRSAKAARVVLKRINTAALEVCGASPGSLLTVRMAVRRSECWHDSVADAVAKIGHPLLTDAYAHSRTHRRS